MWLVYLMALVLGGGLLLLQVLAGAGHGPDLTHELGANHVGGPGLLSTRALIYALFTFGFVGSALHIPGLLEPAWALTAALGAAVAAALLVGYVFSVIGDPKASGAAHARQAAGMKGRMLVGTAPGRRGKVRVNLGGQTVDLLARAEDTIDEGDTVTILEVQDGEARVVRAKP